MKTLTKLIGSIAAAAGAMTLSMAAHAAAFTFQETAGFDCATAVPPPGAGSLDCTGTVAIPPTLVDQSIQWRSGSSPESELVIENPAGFNPVPMGSPFQISLLTHHNRIIPGTNFNFEIDILGRLVLMEGAATVLDDTAPIHISFSETTNLSPCPAPNPLGSTCDDLFQFDVTGLHPLFFAASDGNYRIDFSLNPLLGTFIDGNTVYTREGEDSQLEVLALVSKVPEPATVAILGIGLLGLGLTQRRRRS